MSNQYYPTGNAIFNNRLAVMISFPASQDGWVYSAFLGVLYNMGQWPNWWEFGESTPEDAAMVFRDIFDNRITPVLYDIGDIKWSGSNIAPVGPWLLCDGLLYSTTDYPNLYAAIGTNFNTGGESPTQFRVPDLRGRAAVVVNSGTGRLPLWADSIGGSGGEADHVLTISETPIHTHIADPHTHILTPHTHAEGTATPTIINGGLEAPAASAFPSVGITGPASDGIVDAVVTIESTGGDGSHNNVQPSLALYAYILYAIQ
jgi:microcystin-dependent protein